MLFLFFEKDNVEKYCRAGQATVDAHAHCTLATAGYWHTQSMYYLPLFPRQQWLHERVSVLRSTYIACFVLLNGHSTFILVR